MKKTTTILTLGLALLCGVACEDAKTTPNTPAPEKSASENVSDTKTESESRAESESSPAPSSDTTQPEAKKPSSKELLAANRDIDEIIRLIPKKNIAGSPHRGFWAKDSFSQDFENGVPAVRAIYSAKSVESLDFTKDSGLAKIDAKQDATLIVIHAGRDANATFEHIANEMASRGFKERKQGEIGAPESEKISFWDIDQGVVYLARLDEMVIYSIEIDGGTAGTGSFGAWPIHLFREAWKTR
ncbi:MAG: hypothetical protein KDB07_09485 [Planctomycetes bacterium]|nr:hypothetical protein [Planctomycetota bacterium]